MAGWYPGYLSETCARKYEAAQQISDLVLSLGIEELGHYIYIFFYNSTSLNWTHQLLSVRWICYHTPLWGAAARIPPSEKPNRLYSPTLGGPIQVSDKEYLPNGQSDILRLLSPHLVPDLCPSSEINCAANMKSDIKPFIQPWHTGRGSNQCSASYLKMAFIISDW